eukprot:jgi/Botrbrau1/15452/Bobra.43_2s0076.1
MARIPPADQKTTCEFRLRLVTAPQEGTINRPGHQDGRDWVEVPYAPAYPEVQFNKAAEFSYLEQHAPVVLNNRNAPDGTEDDGNEAIDGRWDQRLLSKLPFFPSWVGSGSLPLLKWLSSMEEKWAPMLTGSSPKGKDLGRPPPLAWHGAQQRLAAADAVDRVHIYDVGAVAPSPGDCPAGPLPPLTPLTTLTHELQAQVAVMAWRPNTGAMLAVGCASGVCLWSVGPSPVSGVAPSRSGSNGAWVMFLPSGKGPVTCLSWSPCGRLLAAPSGSRHGFDVWDVALGSCAHLQAGPSVVDLLRWSPDGNYLLTANSRAHFHLWETDVWDNSRWDLEAGEQLLEATWGADSRSVLLAFEGGRIGMLYLTQSTPSQAAQLLPLPLPELGPRSGARLGACAWDPKGGRLAVVVGGDHPAQGLIALFATPSQPLVAAQLIGFVRPPLSENRDGNGNGKDVPQPALEFWPGAHGSPACLLAARFTDDLIWFLPTYP